MIRFDGYYIEEPIEVYNGRAKEEKSSYSFNAYYFLDKENLKINSKHNLLSNLIDFNKRDFEGDLPIEKKINITNKKVIMLPSFSFENEVVFKVINSDKIFNETSGRYMHFVPWSDSEVNNANNFKNSTIYRLFGPFYHKKFKVYFE